MRNGDGSVRVREKLYDGERVERNSDSRLPTPICEVGYIYIYINPQWNCIERGEPSLPAWFTTPELYKCPRPRRYGIFPHTYYIILRYLCEESTLADYNVANCVDEVHVIITAFVWRVLSYAYDRARYVQLSQQLLGCIRTAGSALFFA